MLQHIDYLFISDEDVFIPINALGKLVKGWVILHHSGGSLCTNGEETFETNIDLIENINVLGAGDMFASSFINEYLKSSITELETIIINSHNQVTNYLKEISNEKN